MFLKTDSGKINKQEVLNMVHHRHPGNICCPDSSERLLSPKSVCDREKIRALHTQWTRQNSSGGSSVTLEQFLCQKLLQDLKDGIGNKNELLQILPAFFRETDLVSIVDCRQILSRSQSRESLVESWDVILGMERSGIMDLNRILPSLDNPEKIVEKLASQLIEWLEREGSDCDPDFEAVLGLILTKVFPLHYRKQNSRSQQSYDKVLDRTLDLLFQRLLGPRGSPGGKQFRRNIMVTVRDGCPLLEVRTKAAFQARWSTQFYQAALENISNDQ